MKTWVTTMAALALPGSAATAGGGGLSGPCCQLKESSHDGYIADSI
jgi:hypothetical protein